jgi:hypothetical protein
MGKAEQMNAAARLCNGVRPTPIEITAMHALCTAVPHLSFNMIHIRLKFKGKWCIALF